MSGPSIYHDPEKIAQSVMAGRHRNVIGGLWEEIGELQLAFLKSHGLQPRHVLLDIGCGSMRLGTKAAAYLEPGNYWGTDLNGSLIDAGYERELRPLGLDARVPRENLKQDTNFQFDGIPRNIDFAMACSVFTHLPLNDVRLCFAQLARHASGPCRFFFTIFSPAPGQPVFAPTGQGMGIQTFSYKDPFHYDGDDLRHAVRGLPRKLTFIGDWNHPRKQQIVEAVLQKDQA